MADQPSNQPYHIEAIEGLRDDFSVPRFRTEVEKCRNVIQKLVAEDTSSEQQIARVHILRYLDLLLERAILWADDKNDLMAIVLRGQIDLRAWAEYVSTGPEEASKFLHEVNIDIRELHEKLDKAYPGTIEPLPVEIKGKRASLNRVDEQEEYDYKLCSKLIHPSVLLLLHTSELLESNVYKERLCVEVLFRGWWIVDRFHDIEWIELRDLTDSADLP
jgi:hypothetical protein